MIQYSDSKITLKIEPHAETGGDYFFRSSLLAKIAGMKIPARDELTYYFYFPVCISCTSGTFAIGGQEYDISEMTISQFLNDIPGAVMRVWCDKVLELNKHLMDFEPADDKKKSE